jgi:glycosyltransferase involved in cell wall biosynthesis
MEALKVAEKFKNRGIELEAVTLDVNSADKGRNLGIMRCGNEIISVIDDDIVLHPETVNVALRYLRDERVAAVGFPVISIKPSLGEKLHHWKFLGLKSVKASTTMPVIFFKKSILMKIGLYRENMGPPLTIHEDWELGSRIRRHGYKVLIVGEIPQFHLSHLRGEGEKPSEHSVSPIYMVKVIWIRVKHYINTYIKKHWWSFFQVLKISPFSQKFEYTIYYLLPLVFTSLLFLNMHWCLIFLMVIFMSIEVYSIAKGYYRKLSLWERLTYPIILVLIRVFRSYLALLGFISNKLVVREGQVLKG